EVEQRADGRVGLAVVVAEVSLEVAFEFGDAPVRKQLPTVREALVQLYFDRAVIADRIGEAVRHAISAGVTSWLAVSAQRLVADAEGGVDEVWVARRWHVGDVLLLVENGREFNADRVDRRVEFRGDVADEIGLAEEVGALGRDHRGVFHYALDAPVEIANRHDPVAG